MVNIGNAKYTCLLLPIGKGEKPDELIPTVSLRLEGGQLFALPFLSCIFQVVSFGSAKWAGLALPKTHM